MNILEIGQVWFSCVYLLLGPVESDFIFVFSFCVYACVPVLFQNGVDCNCVTFILLSAIVWNFLCEKTTIVLLFAQIRIRCGIIVKLNSIVDIKVCWFISHPKQWTHTSIIDANWTDIFSTSAWRTTYRSLIQWEAWMCVKRHVCLCVRAFLLVQCNVQCGQRAWEREKHVYSPKKVFALDKCGR